MFERFTEKARLAVVAAQDCAREAGHSDIRLQHLLVGLRQSDGIAGRLLAEVHPDVAALAEQVKSAPGVVVGGTMVGQIPFAEETKEAMERALREALSLGHNFVGTEHLLLGICRIADSNEPLIPPFEATRQKVIRALSRPAALPDEPDIEGASPDVVYIEVSVWCGKTKVVRLFAPGIDEFLYETPLGRGVAMGDFEWYGFKLQNFTRIVTPDG